MTAEELADIPFHMVSHLSMEGEHCSVYEDDSKRLSLCYHVPYRDGEPCGRTYTHYMIDGKVYKTKEKFIEALKEFEL